MLAVMITAYKKHQDNKIIYIYYVYIYLYIYLYIERVAKQRYNRLRTYDLLR